MKKILFVDDEPNVLSGLKRMLHSHRDQWRMTFAEGGRKALDELEKSPYDIIVSDIRMPGVGGVKLLSDVQERYPKIIRIALSGQSSQGVILRSTGTTQQYLTKPCSLGVLSGAIERSCELNDLLYSENLTRVISKMTSLPTLPSIYIDLIELMKSPVFSMAQVGEIISRDIGLTARILQVINSAYFGLRKRITNPSQAAALLGIDTVRALVLSINVFNPKEMRLLEDYGLESLWNHSFNTGMIARQIALTEDMELFEIDDSLMAGMLHDIGILILLANQPEEYKEVLELTASEGMKIYEAEQSVFNTNHAEIGGFLLKLWGFPDDVIEAVYFHHEPGKCVYKLPSPLTTVHVGNALEFHLHHRGPDELEARIDLGYLEKISLLDRLPDWRDRNEALVNQDQP